jgi:CheY-like chemotaxis protein
MPKHILLIDDDDDVREVAAASLEVVAGWRVSSANSGPVGLEMAKQIQPDAILLDVMMPKQDGPATLLALRGDSATASIPVIFLTAKVLAIELERLREIGASGTLAKPFDPMTLATEVSEILGWRAER